MAGPGGESVRVVTATSRRATTAVTAALVVVASVGTSLLVLTSTTGVAPSPDPRLPRTSPEAAAPPGDVVVLPPRPGEGPVGRGDRSPEPAPTEEPVLGGDLLAEPVLDVPLESEPEPTALPTDEPQVPDVDGPVLVPVVDEEPTGEEPAPGGTPTPRPRPGRGGAGEGPEPTVGAAGGSSGRPWGGAAGTPPRGRGSGHGPTGPGLPDPRGHAYGLRARVFDAAPESPFGLTLREALAPARSVSARVVGPPVPESSSALAEPPARRAAPAEQRTVPAPLRSPAAVDGTRPAPPAPAPPVPAAVPAPPPPPPVVSAPPPRPRAAAAPPAKPGRAVAQRRSPRAAEAAARPAPRAKAAPVRRGGRR